MHAEVHVRRLLAASVATTALLVGCGGGSDTAGEADPAPSASQSEDQDVRRTTVTGPLDAKVLDEGVCAWVETEEGRVEVWVADTHGQLFSFESDDSFEGIRAVDETDPDGAGELLVRRGQVVTVTGTTYESTPECGDYGVEATQPIAAR